MTPVFLAPVALLLLALPPTAPPAWGTAAELAGKARLVEVLRAGLRDEQRRADELRAFARKDGDVPTSTPEPSAIDPETLRRNVLAASLRRQGAWRTLLGTLEEEEAGRIPARLEALLLSCGPNGCQGGLVLHEVEDFVVAFGAPALKPLLDGFGSLDGAKKEVALHLLLRIEPRECPKAVLAAALADPGFRVRSAALDVTRRNCPSGDYQKSLEDLLASETDPEFLLYLLEQVSGDGGRNAWRTNELIRLVQSGRIPADKAFGQLCSATLSGEKPDAAGLNVPFWLGVFETHGSRRACLVQNLFLGLDQERQLVPLRRLFVEAAASRYHFGSVQGLYGPAAPRPASYWDSIPGAADRMLARFQARLGPRAMRAWKDAPDTPLGGRLLLGRWLGDDPAGLLPRTLRLRISVRSAAVVVAEAQREVTLEKPFQLVLPPLAPGLREVDHRGTAWFDADRLCFGLRDFVVGLEPSGAGFAPTIPVDGLFRASLISRGKSFTWEISLSPP